MPNITVSVIMPAFNAEKYISASIDSVLSQEYKDFELIIIDDCSTDSTTDIVAKYTKLHSNVFLYRNAKNSGPAFSRNKGIELAKGSYIAFLDSDDLWDTKKLSLQIDLINNNPFIRFCFTGSSFIDSSGKPYDYTLNVPYKINKRALLKQNIISCSSVLIKKDLMAKYPMPVLSKSLHEDFATWLKILDETDFAYGIDMPLLIYRLSSDSKSGNKFKAAKMNWNTYKYAGISFPTRAYNMLFYSINGLIKYFSLSRKKIQA